MNKKEAFEILDRIAAGIAMTFGSSCETVIHDMYCREHSVVAIYNGHVTGRKIGDRLDILGTNQEISDFLINGTDLINCQGKTLDGKLIKSSTFQFIGNHYHYALGINFDYTFFELAQSSLRDFTAVGTMLDIAMNESAKQLGDIFEECLSQIGKPLSFMQKEDRFRLISLLYERNAFSFQKSVPYVSKKLNISRYTIYNYLKEIKACL